jgi:anti-anti-sigma factor
MRAVRPFNRRLRRAEVVLVGGSFRDGIGSAPLTGPSPGTVGTITAPTGHPETDKAVTGQSNRIIHIFYEGESSMAERTLEVEVTQNDNFVVVRIAGPLDGSALGEFRTQFNRVCRRTSKPVLVDCTRLTYLNSKVILFLQSCHRVRRLQNQATLFCGLNRKVVRTMDLLGLGKDLVQCPTLEAGVARLYGKTDAAAA